MGNAAEMPDHLQMAKELDGMDRDVTSWEADFLENVLNLLEKGKSLTPKQEATLEMMWQKYLGEKNGEGPFGGDEAEDSDEGELDL